jgi:hypothetical protein
MKREGTTWKEGITEMPDEKSRARVVRARLGLATAVLACIASALSALAALLVLLGH